MRNTKPTPIIIINGIQIRYVDRIELANALGKHKDTISDWVDRGILPPPFDPNAATRPKGQKQGRKDLSWDLYECLERYHQFRSTRHKSTL